MTRAYIRLDPSFDERKYEYPDGAYSALVATLCLAEHQPQRGRFRSPRYLAGLLGKRGRWVKYLLEQGDLSSLSDGRVYVDGWDEWQEGDWKVSERVQRIRSRPRNGQKAPDVTPDVTVDVTARRNSGSGGNSNSGSGDDPLVRVTRAISERTGRDFQFRPGSWVFETLAADVRDFGPDDVLRAVASQDIDKPDIAQLVSGATKALHPLPSGKVAVASHANAAQIERRNEVVWSRRLEHYRNTGTWDPAWGNPPKEAA